MFHAIDCCIQYRHASSFIQPSIFIDISRLPAIFSKQPAAMIREDLACHDEATRVAFCEQSVKFSFTQSRSLQSVQFIEPSPIGFVPQIHAFTFDCGFEDRRVVEICDAIKKRLDDGVFSPTCLSICPFQGSRLLTNLRVVEAQLRYNFAGFWFDLNMWTQDGTFVTNLLGDIS